ASSSKACADAPFTKQANGARTFTGVPNTLQSPGALLRLACSMTIWVHGICEPKVQAPTVSMMQSFARSMTSGGMLSYLRLAANSESTWEAVVPECFISILRSCRRWFSSRSYQQAHSLSAGASADDVQLDSLDDAGPFPGFRLDHGVELLRRAAA